MATIEDKQTAQKMWNNLFSPLYIIYNNRAVLASFVVVITLLGSSLFALYDAPTRFLAIEAEQEAHQDILCYVVRTIRDNHPTTESIPRACEL